MEQRRIVESFVESMNQLMEILQTETDILNTQVYEGIDTLQARKVQLTKHYLEAQNKMQDSPDVVTHLNETERNDLKILYKKFRNTLSENMLTLRGSYDATDRVVNLVIEAVKKQRGVTKKNIEAFAARPQGYAAYSTPESANAALNTQT